MALALVFSGCTPSLPTATPVVMPTATQVVATPTAAATSTATPTALPPTATATITPSPTPTAMPLPPTVSGSEAWRHVDHLATAIGPRPVGSSAERAAADYLAQQLAAFGYSVERQSFSFENYVEQGTQLRVESPRQLELSSRVLRLSVPGQARGQLVDVGLGRPADLSGKDLKGKIALVRRGEISFHEKVANVAAAGAVGVVVSNDEAGNFGGSLNSMQGVPAVSISLEDGEQLRALLSAGEVVVSLQVRARLDQGSSENVIGARPGSTDKWLVISAHYDSVAGAAGANDDASGVGVALELARVLALREQPYTVQVAFFGAEEIGLLGSRHFVDSLSPERRRALVANVNLDMVGVGTDLALSGSDALLERALAAGGAVGLSPSRLTDRRTSASDHASFQMVGLPALFVTWGPDPNYHTAKDVAGEVRPQLLADTGRLVLRLLEMMSNG